MNIKNILFVTLLIISSGRIIAAAAPQVKASNALVVDQKQAMENPEQVLEKLAYSLGFRFSINRKENGFIDIALTDNDGNRCAYLIGFLNNAYLSRLEVCDSNLRNHKIGTVLFEMFRYECFKKGHEKMRWTASSFGNNIIPHHALLAFYKKLGGRVMGGNSITYNDMECDIMSPFHTKNAREVSTHYCSASFVRLTISTFYASM